LPALASPGCWRRCGGGGCAWPRRAPPRRNAPASGNRLAASPPARPCSHSPGLIGGAPLREHRRRAGSPFDRRSARTVLKRLLLATRVPKPLVHARVHEQRPALGQYLCRLRKPSAWRVGARAAGGGWAKSRLAITAGNEAGSSNMYPSAAISRKLFRYRSSISFASAEMSFPPALALHRKKLAPFSALGGGFL